MEMGIVESFRNRTVFITEKLLRSCSVDSIAILVRNKKGLSASQRATEIYEQALFDRLCIEKPGFKESIRVIDGHSEDLLMGLSSSDREWLKNNVNFVFHCAATIKFKEPLELASKINVQGTEHILTLVSQMKNLKGFVHVSTAYSHCPRSEIKEEFYNVPMTSKELKNMFFDEKSITKQKQSNSGNEVPKIYNYVSCVESSLTWGRFIREMHGRYYLAPHLQSMWYTFYIFYTNFTVESILRFFLHRIPGAFMDLLLIFCCKSPKMLRMYAKTENMIDLLYEFSTRQRKFDNGNTRELWLSLSQEKRFGSAYRNLIGNLT